MSRVCDITGKKTLFGKRVSHAHNKSSRKFRTNLRDQKFYAEELNIWIPLRVTAHGMRIIRKNGVLPSMKRAYQQGVLPSRLVPFVKSFNQARNG